MGVIVTAVAPYPTVNFKGLNFPDFPFCSQQNLLKRVLYSMQFKMLNSRPFVEKTWHLPDHNFLETSHLCKIPFVRLIIIFLKKLRKSLTSLIIPM